MAIINITISILCINENQGRIQWIPSLIFVLCQDHYFMFNNIFAKPNSL